MSVYLYFCSKMLWIVTDDMSKKTSYQLLYLRNMFKQNYFRILFLVYLFQFVCNTYVFSSASWFKKQQGHGFFSLTYFTDRFIFTKICCFILILLLRWFSFYPSEHIYRIFLIEINKDIFKIIFYEKLLSFEGVQGIIMLINVKSLKSICILYMTNRVQYLFQTAGNYSVFHKSMVTEVMVLPRRHISLFIVSSREVNSKTIS